MDIENLLRLFSAYKVKYILIGATAFPVHGYARTTLDIDVFIEPSEKNAQVCLKSLKELGYDTSDIAPGTFLQKKTLFRQYLLEIDIHPYVKGVTFQRIWKNRVRKRIGTVYANFACLNDLITMKKAAGRLKDKQDLAILLELQRRKRSKKK